MVDPNNFDDLLLYLEELQGQHLATIDDRAMEEQNRVISNARMRFIPD